MKKNVLIIVSVSLFIILVVIVGVTSYSLGSKSNNSYTKGKESMKSNLTPTVTLEPAVAATESSEISPTITPEPSVTLILTPTATPAKKFVIPPANLRIITTPTSTPTPKPTLIIPKIKVNNP